MRGKEISEASVSERSAENSSLRRTKYIKLRIKPVESIIIEKQGSTKRKKVEGARSKSMCNTKVFPRKNKGNEGLKKILMRYPHVMQTTQLMTRPAIKKDVHIPIVNLHARIMKFQRMKRDSKDRLSP